MFDNFNKIISSGNQREFEDNKSKNQFKLNLKKKLIAKLKREL
mgnify:FL=1